MAGGHAAQACPRGCNAARNGSTFINIGTHLNSVHAVGKVPITAIELAQVGYARCKACLRCYRAPGGQVAHHSCKAPTSADLESPSSTIEPSTPTEQPTQVSSSLLAAAAQAGDAAAFLSALAEEMQSTVAQEGPATDHSGQHPEGRGSAQSNEAPQLPLPSAAPPTPPTPEELSLLEQFKNLAPVQARARFIAPSVVP
ncbi:hypothetical protein OC844_005886, partial [Tilletia horrida]